MPLRPLLSILANSLGVADLRHDVAHGDSATDALERVGTLLYRARALCVSCASSLSPLLSSSLSLAGGWLESFSGVARHVAPVTRTSHLHTNPSSGCTTLPTRSNPLLVSTRGEAPASGRV